MSFAEFWCHKIPIFLKFFLLHCIVPLKLTLFVVCFSRCHVKNKDVKRNLNFYFARLAFGNPIWTDNIVELSLVSTTLKDIEFVVNFTV